MTERIRVLVADDHPLFRDGVVATLRGDAGVEVVGEASSAEEAVAKAGLLRPDVALLDITMPGGGLAAAREIATACPSTRIVMLTVSEDDDDLMNAMKAGASGYVLKGVSATELVRIVRSIHGGEAYVAPSLAFGLLREMTGPRRPEPMAELTEREREVLGLVARGLSNFEVGRELGLAEKTVKHYMSSVLAKLHVRSRVEAALLVHGVGVPKQPGG